MPKPAAQSVGAPTAEATQADGNDQLIADYLAASHSAITDCPASVHCTHLGLTTRTTIMTIRLVAYLSASNS